MPKNQSNIHIELYRKYHILQIVDIYPNQTINWYHRHIGVSSPSMTHRDVKDLERLGCLYLNAKPRGMNKVVLLTLTPIGKTVLSALKGVTFDIQARVE